MGKCGLKWRSRSEDGDAGDAAANDDGVLAVAVVSGNEDDEYEQYGGLNN